MSKMSRVDLHSAFPPPVFHFRFAILVCHYLRAHNFLARLPGMVLISISPPGCKQAAFWNRRLMASSGGIKCAVINPLSGKRPQGPKRPLKQLGVTLSSFLSFPSLRIIPQRLSGEKPSFCGKVNGPAMKCKSRNAENGKRRWEPQKESTLDILFLVV